MRNWVDTSKWPEWRVRAERVGLTLGRLARDTDTPEPTVRKWANGTRPVPDTWLSVIAGILDLAEREKAS